MLPTVLRELCVVKRPLSVIRDPHLGSPVFRFFLCALAIQKKTKQIKHVKWTDA